MGRDSRIAMVRLGAESKHFMQNLRDAERATQAWGNRVKGHITKSLRAGFGGLGGIAGLAGVASFGSMARDVMTFNARLVDLQISAGKSRGAMLEFNSALQATAAATGAQQEELIAGAQKYTELTGKFDEFAASMDTFAKAQVATGASMESLVGAAAALSTNLNVNPSQMLAALDAITAQGKSGKIEIKDLAQELPGLTGQFAQFRTVGVKGTVELGAAMQIMARGFGSASETATGMSSLMTAFVKNSKQLKGIGVNVFDKGGKMRDFADIMFELIDKSKGDPRVLQKVLGRTEAVQAILPIMAAGRAEFERFVAIGAKGGVVMEDFGKRSKEAPMQMAQAMAKLKATMNEALIKNLDALVTAFEAIVKAMSWMASHPEAMIALAALWKGGGFLGAVGGLGMGAGAGGAAGALGGAAGGGAGGARGARTVQALGGMMQGAAAGYALSRVGDTFAGKGTKDSLDSLATAGVTAAGALAGLGGPIGLLGAAIMGIKAITDMYIAGIEEQQNRNAKKTITDFFFERGSDMGIGANGLDMGTRIPGKVRDKERAGASSVMAEAKAQGFMNEDGTIDEKKMGAWVDRQDLSKEEKARAKQIFRAAVRVRSLDAQANAATPEQVSTGALFDEAGANAPGLMEQNPGGPGSVMKQTVEIALKLLPGISIVDDKTNRRKSR